MAALAGVVALQRQTDLHNAPPQQDKPHRANQRKDERGEIFHDHQRVTGGKGGQGKNNAAHHDGVQRKQIERDFHGFFVMIQLHLGLLILCMVGFISAGSVGRKSSISSSS